MTKEKATKIKELREQLLDLDKRAGGAFSSGAGNMSTLFKDLLKEETNEYRAGLQERPVMKGLDRLSKEFTQLKKDLDFKPLVDMLEAADSDNKGRMMQLSMEFDERIEEMEKAMSAAESRGSQLTASEAKKLMDQMTDLQEIFDGEIKGLSSKGALLQAEVERLSQELGFISKKLGEPTDDSATQATLVETAENTKRAQETAEECKKLLDELRRDLMSRIAGIQRGGGNANRNITLGGASLLTKYTDINFIAGSNITLAAGVDITNARTNITISGSAGGSGITRSTSVITADTTGGTAAATDYLYFANEGITFTLPTAVGNTNTYTVKNFAASSVLIAVSAGQDIDGSSTALMPTQYESLTFISNGSVWGVV